MSEREIFLKFFEKTYELRVNESDFDVADVIEYVEGKVNAFQARHPGLTQNKIIVLMMLDMGKDYVMLRKKMEEEKNYLESKAKYLTSKIDIALDFLDY